MKFAFSTLTCPAWDAPTLAARAKEFAYDGLEFAGPDLLARAAAAPALADANLPICCLATDLRFTGDKSKDSAAADQLRQTIDAAQHLHCPLVKLLDAPVRPGQSTANVGVALSAFLAPLADYACDHAVTLVVTNALGFRAARDLWTVLERVNHPAVACAFDPLAAARIGESPYLSVPILNSRIQYACLADAALPPNAAPVPCPFGQGSVPLRQLIIRLRGIGYQGWVTVHYDSAAAPALDPQSALPNALKLLKQWQSEGIPTPKPAKPTHKPTPTPAKPPAPANA